MTVAIVQPKDDSLLRSVKKAQQQGWIDPYYFRDDSPLEAARQAVVAVKKRICNMIMKGDLSTSVLLKAVLEKNGLSIHGRLSHVAVVETPTYAHLMLWTDGGVNIVLDKIIIIQIIENALQVSAVLGNSCPNVSMLTLVEKVVPELPETQLAWDICDHFSERKDFTVEGPIALDVALSVNAAARKSIDSAIAGKTNIFVGPSITATNHIVKALSSLGHAKVGGVVVGAQVPIVLLSRADDENSRFNSLSLGALLSLGEKNGYS
ncbi:MAG: phosphate butyryltransferase [Candidatus Marinimicrobia bacterium]|nr:phosphate butyryltransferase [Candidatus Neomarinimicrobiota bacterium]